jgi:DNA repair exonuclease SbcCD ATPase subunit
MKTRVRLSMVLLALFSGCNNKDEHRVELLQSQLTETQANLATAQADLAKAQAEATDSDAQSARVSGDLKAEVEKLNSVIKDQSETIRAQTSSIDGLNQKIRTLYAPTSSITKVLDDFELTLMTPEPTPVSLQEAQNQCKTVQDQLNAALAQLPPGSRVRDTLSSMSTALQHYSVRLSIHLIGSMGMVENVEDIRRDRDDLKQALRDGVSSLKEQSSGDGTTGKVP